MSPIFNLTELSLFTANHAAANTGFGAAGGIELHWKTTAKPLNPEAAVPQIQRQAGRSLK